VPPPDPQLAPNEPAKPAASAAATSAKAAGVVGLAVMCSRVLGLARDQIFAGLFGAGVGMDAFLTAFRAPNLLRDLFAEGALSTAFITTFSKKIATEGDRSAWTLANKMATLTLVFMSVVTLVGIVFSPQLIAVLGGGFSPEKTQLTILLTRVMFPFILLVSLAALVMGMLNAKRVFGAPAMASSFFNLGSIVGGVTLCYVFDPQKDWRHPHFGPHALLGLALGTLIGGFLQFVVQLPPLARVGYRFRPDFGWRDEGVRTILRLMGPAVIAASAVQVNVMVNASFASYQGDGAVSWLSYAFRLMQLPLGVFGVAIATVTLPLVSSSAALGDAAAFRGTLARALRLAFFLTIPSAIGLICLGNPIIGLLFERGRFHADATAQTAGALQFYAVGLAAYAGIKVLAPAFYALDARNTPMMVSFIAIGTNLLLNSIFTWRLHWGHRGLALSTSLTAIINFGLLYILMRRRTGRLETGHLFSMLARLAVAGAMLAAVCLLGQRYLLDGFGQFTLPWKCITLFGVIGMAAAVFFAACYLLRINEMRDAVGVVESKLRRRRQAR
jgi:putative peptidoglycan lipid II flippase